MKLFKVDKGLKNVGKISQYIVPANTKVSRFTTSVMRFNQSHP